MSLIRSAGLSLIVVLLALPACTAQVATQKTEVAPAVAAPPDDLLNATIWMQGTVEHDMLVAQSFRLARTQLDRALAEPQWNALPEAERENAAGGTPAIIVDVDETVLDNSPFQARMIRAGTDFDQAAWDQWCSEASARPLPGALEFARYAAARGVTMFYVTNRSLKAKDWTEQNLRRAGFPLSDREPVVFMAGDPAECAAAGTAKSCRRQLVARTHRVVMLIGDQLSDFIDLPKNTPEGRAQAAGEYAEWFGERWLIQPNPMYGSWDTAITAPIRGAPRAEKRAFKRAALRLE
jgi:acid phosphatase